MSLSCKAVLVASFITHIRSENIFAFVVPMASKKMETFKQHSAFDPTIINQSQLSSVTISQSQQKTTNFLIAKKNKNKNNIQILRSVFNFPNRKPHLLKSNRNNHPTTHHHGGGNSNLDLKSLIPLTRQGATTISVDKDELTNSVAKVLPPSTATWARTWTCP